MKFFIIAALLVAAASAAEYGMKSKEDLMRIRKECVAELGVSATLVADYQNRIFTPEGVTPCYIRCIFSRLGLFDDKTGFNIGDYLIQTEKGETIRAGVEACIDNTGTDTCLWAYRGFMCFFKADLLPVGY